MTQDEIIEMARQSGLIGKPTYTEGLEMFAKLVAEKEREACAEICEWSECAGAIRARGQE